jgi:hypothetical protein
MKNLPDIKPWRVPPRRVEKDAEKALHSRQLGNGAFVKRDLPAALRHYNDSLRFCPVVTDDEQTDLALAFGNRFTNYISFPFVACSLPPKSNQS